MTLNIIDRRCTVNVQPTPQGYTFQYGGKTYRRSTQESLHAFFLEQTSLDTVKLRLPNEKYYLHLTLDEPEEFFSKNALRRVLSQESQGAWIEEKNEKQRYFVDKGWVFSRIEEVSEEEFFSKQSSTLAQKVASFIGTVALGALALGSKMPHKTNRASSVGFVSGALFRVAGVFAQMPVGGEFRINTNVTRDQQNSQIARLEDGDFVTVWHGSQTGDYDIYAQIYNATEGLTSSEFRCNMNVTSNQYSPVVARLIGGGFVTVWHGSQNGNADIYAQIYNAIGEPISSEMRCNTNVTGNQYFSAVTGLLGGGFVVAWSGDQTGNYDIYAQIYNATGGPIGSELRCNTNVTGYQYHPAVAGLQNGGFVTAWHGDQTGNSDIYAQIFNAIGRPIGSEFRCNTNVTDNQYYPGVAGLLDGSFVMVWHGYQTGNYDIYGQKYEVSDNSILNFSSSSGVLSLSTSHLTTMLISSSSSPQPSASFPSITTLSYETTYSIIINGLDIGSFIFQGGTGLIDGTQSNTITLNIDSGLVGETFTLFNIPPGVEGQFATIELVGQSSCQSYGSQIVQDGASQAFQVVFQGTTCALAARPAAEFFSINMLKV